MNSMTDYLDLYDFRMRVSSMYRSRNQALVSGEDPRAVLDFFRKQRDELFRTHPQSALAPEQKSRFQGLAHYPYNADACVDARLEPYEHDEKVLIGTSGSETMPMVPAAKAHFTLAGRESILTMYWIEVYGGGLFLPFRDATASVETYGGGRYLFDTVKGSDFLVRSRAQRSWRILLDFNYAYNPSCSYNHHWVCPLAPPENHLPFPIPAGEKDFLMESHEPY